MFEILFSTWKIDKGSLQIRQQTFKKDTLNRTYVLENMGYFKRGEINAEDRETFNISKRRKFKKYVKKKSLLVIFIDISKMRRIFF